LSNADLGLSEFDFELGNLFETNEKTGKLQRINISDQDMNIEEVEEGDESVPKAPARLKKGEKYKMRSFVPAKVTYRNDLSSKESAKVTYSNEESGPGRLCIIDHASYFVLVPSGSEFWGLEEVRKLECFVYNVDPVTSHDVSGEFIAGFASVTSHNRCIALTFVIRFEHTWCIFQLVMFSSLARSRTRWSAGSQGGLFRALA
jgi:hypothetical protein